MCKRVALQEIVHIQGWLVIERFIINAWRLGNIDFLISNTATKMNMCTIKQWYIRIRWPGWLSGHYYIGELFITRADRDSLRTTSHAMTLISSASHQMATLLIWPGKIYVNWGIFDKLSMIFLVKICYVSLQVYLNTYNIKNIISWFV